MYNQGIANRRYPHVIIPSKSGIASKISETITQSPDTFEAKQVEKFKNNFMEVLKISRPPKTQLVTVGITPTKILEPPHEWPYLIANPSLAVGLTTSYTWTLAAVNASGNVQATSLGVANFLECHLHINITAITGAATWDLIAQSKDPAVVGAWADVQNIFINLDPATLVAPPYTFYDRIGQQGLCTDFAFRYVKNGGAPADALTAQVTATLKEGIGGGSTGTARTLYIGGYDVTTDTGLDIPEGGYRIVELGPDITLYAIANIPIPIKIFTL